MMQFPRRFFVPRGPFGGLFLVFLVSAWGCGAEAQPRELPAPQQTRALPSPPREAPPKAITANAPPASAPAAQTILADADDVPAVDVPNLDVPTDNVPTPAAPRAEQRNVPQRAARYLIIHADDAGLCSPVNRATIDAIERGLISSVSMMVPCPAFEEFAQYAKEHPDGDYGVHLTLNSEFASYRWGPVLPPNEVPSLVDRRGHFWAEERQTAANARADDVERELTAQIERARNFGVPLSHLDTHMGTLFTRPDLLEIYVNLGVKYQLPVLIVRNQERLRMFPLDDRVRRGIGSVVVRLDRQRMPVLDGLYMNYGYSNLDQKRRYYREMFASLPQGVSEVLVHCGYNTRELYAITGSAPMRDADRRVFIDPRTADEIAEQGIKIINWKQFREMANSPRPENERKNER